jgi:cyclopropane-fatty-acyl-phospholipid synthase
VSGSSVLRKAIRNLCDSIHRADPSAAFSFELWNGEAFRYHERPKVTLRLNTQQSAKDLVSKGFLGFGEAYMAGEMEVDGELQELLRLGFAISFDEHALPFPLKILLWALSQTAQNTRNQALKNASHHYDRGDDFYSLFLDPTLTYSCAYFRDTDDTLEQAQLNKYELIARKLQLRPGETLLDIGCGWGGMLIYAATKYGVRGLGNTLSRNQCEYARRKIKELKLQDRIEIIVADYRDLSGTFDKLVSIGMFEHVGKRFIPIFMHKVSALLKRGGMGLLHTIGKEVDAATDPWIDRYIFPGGYIPNLQEMLEHMAKMDLSVLHVENLRIHYARTVDCWLENYERNATQVKEMFGEAFVRMWRLYLNASSACFKYGTNRLYQILFSNGLTNNLSMTRDDLYR